MNKQLFLFLFAFFVAKTVFPQLNSYDSIVVGSDWRTFRVHLPKGYNPLSAYPLVLAFHGGGGNALQFSLTTELSSKSDSAGFIVVFPEGKRNPGVIGVRTWNAGYCCANNSTVGTDDVGFISQLVDTLQSRYAIDTNRIYATGHSNGGMMCYRLATELSEKIAAVAISSATMVRNYPFTPKRPVPIIHFHSYKDQNVPYYGGEIMGVVPPVHSPPVDSIISIWSDFDQCRTHDTIHKSPEYNEIVFNKGICDSQVNLYVTYDGGHAWPGGNPGNGPDSDTPSKVINANYLLWKFFQQYTLYCTTTGIKEIDQQQFLLIYPNPVYSSFTLQLPPIGAYEVCIYDAAMKKIKHLTNCHDLIEFNSTDMLPGFYILEATSDRKVLRAKFIKVKD
ncbi:MAG TPA: PHB depolymerase family esterase [Bacteroidia bacterium]|jgi:polyhydroxybutyrate depolymerase|nr:PHB depolymerase family esterase [Bacteroidia bacterium]HRG51599.1 PHB depolymerase family esterase [Bacteroidia bacterium]